MFDMGFDESVLICDEVDPVLNKILEDNGLAVSYEPKITPEQILEKINLYSIVIVRSRTTITKDMIEKANNCKILARVGVGLDNIDLDAARVRDIRVINAAEGAINAVAELVLGLMLSLARKISYTDRGIRGRQMAQGRVQRNRASRQVSWNNRCGKHWKASRPSCKGPQHECHRL